MDKIIITTLNCVGGVMFATGSLWFLHNSIGYNQYSLQAAICANSQNGCPNLKDLHKRADDALISLGIYSAVGSIGAGLVCFRKSID